MRFIARLGLVFGVVFWASLGLGPIAEGAVHEWTGIYPFDEWSFPLNWTPNSPHSTGAPSGMLVFHDGSGTNTARNDFGTYQVNSLIFPETGGVLTIDGDPLYFNYSDSTIQDDSEFVNIIKNDLIVPQALTITASKSAGIELQLTGNISGEGDLIKEGPGLVLIDDIEMGGDISINDGTVYFYDENPFVNGGGNLHIGAGAQVNLEGGPATNLYSLSGSGNLSLHSTGSVAVGLNDETFTFTGSFLNGSLGTTIEKRGSGDFWLNGDANETVHEGRLVVYEGSVLLNRSTADMQGGFVIVGDGVGGAEADVLALRWHEQISTAADGGDVLVNSSGLFDVAGYTEEIRSLTIGPGGVVDTDRGSLTILETLQLTGGTLKMNGGEVRTHSLLESPGATYDYEEGGSFTVDGGTATFISGLYFGGGTDEDRATLNIENGATATGSGSSIGGLPGEYSTLNVTGAAGAQPSTLSLFNSTVGFRGTADFNVTDGGTVDIELESVLGGSTGSDGSMLVSGVNGGLRSTVDVDGPFARIVVASQGTGELTVADGGYVHSAGYIVVSQVGTGVGTVTVGGAAGGYDAMLAADGNLYVGGGTTSAGGSGTVNVLTDGQVNVNEVMVYPSGEVHLVDGGVLAAAGTAAIDEGMVTVSGTDGAGNASTWNSATSLIVGTNSTGSLQVTDGGQVLSLTGVVGNVSGSDGSATISGTDGAGNPSEWTVGPGFFIVGNNGGGSVDVLAGGKITSASGYLGVGVGSDGIMTVSGDGSEWHNTGDVVVGRGGGGDTASLSILDEGLVTVDGTLTLAATGTLILDGGRLVADTLDYNAPATFDFIDGELSVGTIDGDLDVEGGTVAPGGSPGTTNVAGNYSQDAASTMEIELAGLTPDSEYDQVHVSGTATLDGTLEVALLDGFFPAPGEEFEVLTYAARSGEFATYTGTGLIDADTALVPVYGVTELTLVTAIAGDVNLDGEVNGLDANIVSANFLTAGGYGEGDANFDGVVDGLDANLISGHFLQMNPAKAVPEPRGLGLAVVGIGCFLAIRRRT